MAFITVLPFIGKGPNFVTYMVFATVLAFVCDADLLGRGPGGGFLDMAGRTDGGPAISHGFNGHALIRVRVGMDRRLSVGAGHLLCSSMYRSTRATGISFYTFTRFRRCDDIGKREDR